ncbi:MAG: InlB B-repeat-containing protein, partial [Anaerovoracaceae bacterium]
GHITFSTDPNQGLARLTGAIFVIIPSPKDATAKTFAVSFNTQGGEPKSISNVTVRYDDFYSKAEGGWPRIPVKKGQDFMGWFTSSEGSEKPLVESNGAEKTVVKITRDITLMAHWKTSEYEISTAELPEKVGGTVVGAGKKHHGDFVHLVAIPNEGYSFKQWREPAIKDGNNPFGVINNAGDRYSFMAESNRTLFADFELNVNALNVAPNDLTMGKVTSVNASKMTDKDGITNGKVDAGSVVTLKATAENGYKFVNWTVAGSQVSVSSTYNIKIFKDTRLIANFAPVSAKVYKVNIATSGMGLTLGSGTYYEGQLVSAIAKPDPGYSLERWTEGKARRVLGSGSIISFKMPSFEVNLMATFGNRLSEYSIITETNKPAMGDAKLFAEGDFEESSNSNFEYGTELIARAVAKNGYKFANWTVNGVAVSSDKEYNVIVESDMVLLATFVPESIQLKNVVSVLVNSGGNGIATGSGLYADNQIATIKAIPNEGYEFQSWKAGDEELDDDLVREGDTYSFIVNSDMKFIAKFVKKRFSILASSSETARGTVSITPAANSDGKYEFGSLVTAEANAKTGSKFVNWTIDGVFVSNSRIFTFPVKEKKRLVANFVDETAKTFVVAASATDNGEILGTGIYAEGQIATLSAKANLGYSFIGWDNGIKSEDYVFTVSEDLHIIGEFRNDEKMIKIDLVETIEANDKVEFISPKENTESEFERGTYIVIKASTADDRRFINWTVNGVQVSSSALYGFYATEDTEIKANFAAFADTADKVRHMDVSSDANGTVKGSGNYLDNGVVRVTAIPSRGYQLKKWTAPSGNLPEDFKTDEESTNCATFKAADDYSIKATFEPQKFVIAADVNIGTGGARVFTQNQDIDTSKRDNKTAQIKYGEKITLTAEARAGEADFVGWQNPPVGAEFSGKDGSIISFTVTGEETLQAMFKESSTPHCFIKIKKDGEEGTVRKFTALKSDGPWEEIMTTSTEVEQGKWVKLEAEVKDKENNNFECWSDESHIILDENGENLKGDYIFKA